MLVLSLSFFMIVESALPFKELQTHATADPTTKEWVNINLPAGPYYIIDEPVFVVNVGDCLSELTGGSCVLLPIG